MAPPKTIYYEGQKFSNPSDPNAPNLVYSKKAGFVTEAAYGEVSKLDPADAAELKSMGGEAGQSIYLADRARRFMDIQGNGASAVGTGPVYGRVPFTPQGLNVARGVQNALSMFGGGDAQKLSDLDSVNNQTWAMMRPVGSGRMTKMETEGFKAAFPNTANLGTANQDMADRLASEAHDRSAEYDFTSKFLHAGQGNIGAARMAWAQQQASQGGQAPAAAPARTMVPRSMAAPAAVAPTDPAAYAASLKAKFAQ